MKPLESTGQVHELAGGRLLVVGNRECEDAALMEQLARAGYEVLAAGDAATAIRMVQTNDVELVLLEAALTETSSIDLLRLLRLSYSPEELPVVLMALHRQTETIVQALDQGANDHVAGEEFPVALARIKSQIALKRADRMLRRMREREELTSRLSNDGVWDWDLSADTVEYSDRWKECLGLAPGVAPVLATWTDRIHPDDRDRVVDQLAECRLPNGPSELVQELRMQRIDGTYCWVLNRAAVIRGPSGRAERVVGTVLDVTLNKSLDPLTALPNRAGFLDALAQTIRTCADTEHGFAILLLNLDRFKIVNQTLGQLRGDELLRAVSRRLQGIVRTKGTRKHDIVARISGDEFGVILSQIDSEGQARRAAQRVLSSLQEPFSLSGTSFWVSATIGIVVTSPGFQDPTALLRNADTALQRGKVLGRSRVVVFEPSMRESLEERIALEADLGRAIERGQLEVYYQPKVLLESSRVTGFEALVRWNHPTRGLMVPTEFIALAESSGSILDIDRWVLETACRQVRHWQLEVAGSGDCELSSNLSVSQLRQPDLEQIVADILERTGFPPHLLQLEITESICIADLQEAARILGSLKQLGIGLKMDDFGTGYSSLNYLAKLPFDYLKIDRTFVSQMCEEPQSLEVVTSIISLADKLHLKVVAEGVERKEQADRLLRLGCRYGQGYYFAAPVNAQEATRLLQKSNG